MTKFKKKILEVIKVLGKVILGILIFLLLVFLFVRSPWGQDIIKEQVIKSIEKRSKAGISLERIFIQFDGDIAIEELLITEPDNDTIIFSESITANIGLWPLINSNNLNLNEVDAINFRANIIRKDSLGGFNYEMLMASSSPTKESQPADTSSTGMAIKIGNINLQDFDINFIDEVTGIDSSLKFEELSTKFQEFDLNQMIFRLEEVTLGRAHINYNQTKAFPPSEESEAALPTIGVDKLLLTDVVASYNSQPDGITSKNRISRLELDHGEINLQKMLLNGELLSLSDSEIGLDLSISDVQSETHSNADKEFWPEWKISWKNIDLRNNKFNYSLNQEIPQPGLFKPEAISIDSLYFIADDISLKENSASARIEDFKFQEASGINLNRFTLNLEISDEKMVLDQIEFRENSNSFNGKAIIGYTSLKRLIEEPATAKIEAAISNLRINIEEIFRFQPELKKNPYIAALAKNPVSGNFRLKGDFDQLYVGSLDASWASTSINASGSLGKLQQPKNLAYNFPNLRLKTDRTDLLKFINEKDFGLKLPQTILVAGNFSGSGKQINTNSVLKTSEGTIKVNGNFSSVDKIVFEAEVTGDSIALGDILQNEKLGNLGINIKARGEGGSLDALDASLDATIRSFTYNDYEFRKININGEFENGTGPIKLIYKDNNLDLQAESLIELNETNPRMEFLVNVQGADLGGMGITNKPIKTGFKLEGWYQGDGSNYEVKADIIDGVAVFNNKTYLLGNFKAFAYVRPDTTSIDIDNRIINLDLRSNADPVAFSQSLNRHFKRYITEDFTEDTVSNPVNLKLDAQINEAPILTEVFMVNLEELDSVDVQVDFSEKEHTLDANVNIPYVNFYNSEIDSLEIKMDSDREDLKFKLAFNRLNAGPLNIKRTILSGNVIDRKLNLDFSSLYKKDSLVNVNSVLNFKGDTLKYHIDPRKLILNGNSWKIAENNQVSIATEYLDFREFLLSREKQQMQISNHFPGGEKEELKLEFRNFKLAALLNYLNPETQLAQGELNGNLIYEEPFGKTGLIADMEINQFKILEVDMNTLSLKGNSTGFDTYEFEMAVKGGEVDLDLTGSYIAQENSAMLDMNLDINKVQMSAIEGFSKGEITNTSGSFSGSINLNGTFADPEYQGELLFNDAKFNLAFLNAPFTLPRERLRLDNEGLYFDDFNIHDSSNNKIVFNGEVITRNLLNPEFDLDVQAENFSMLNSTEEDNDLFYGTAVVDLDAQVEGDLNLPIVNMDIDVKEATNFTYVIPETQLQMNERDGVVTFVNKENPDDILSQTEEESYIVSGYDIFSRIRVTPGARFTVILNEETGDRFQVQGEGDLLFNMYPNGRLSLTGIYEINDGFYEMSLYNLVKRRFGIADGSRVSWAGDPFEAQLDVRAIYEVEASAASLMQPQLTGTDPNIRSQYGQQLPFLVYLNVDGELMEPKITFGLDMPEDEQGAAGGQVYGRIQQLNNQEQELNKQVFSLLVLNRFFPAGGSDGSAGGTLAVARDNLSQALTDQLNMLSSRILGESGLQLNFEVDSFTGSEGQARTQLGVSAQKGFMENRLIVEVGSEVDIEGANQVGQESSPLIGNVSVSYLLEEDGTWRIKGFSKNQFENVIDGQLVVSGIALIFTKEFNKFKNMFEKAVMEEVGKNKKKLKKGEVQKSSEINAKNEN